MIVRPRMSSEAYASFVVPFGAGAPPTLGAPFDPESAWPASSASPAESTPGMPPAAPDDGAIAEVSPRVGDSSPNAPHAVARAASSSVPTPAQYPILDRV